MGKINLFATDGIFVDNVCTLCGHIKDKHWFGGCLDGHTKCGCDNTNFVNDICPKCNHSSSEHIKINKSNSALLEKIRSVGKTKTNEKIIYDKCNANIVGCKCMGNRQYFVSGRID